MRQHWHLVINGRPACEYFGGMAGMDAARAAGIAAVCSYVSEAGAESAMDALAAVGCYSHVQEGYCPTAAADEEAGFEDTDQPTPLPPLTKQAAMSAFATLVNQYGLQWRADVPRVAWDALAEVNKVLDEGDRREALGLRR